MMDLPPAPEPGLVVVGTTLAAFVMDDPDTCLSWLAEAEAMLDSWPAGVRFFAALELDARGIAPFGPLLERMAELDEREIRAGRGPVCSTWTYTLDDGRTEVTTANRLRHIVAGQNLATDFALSAGASHLLFLAADLRPDPATIPKLVEVDHPLVGGHVSTYCLDGPMAPRPYPFPVKVHMATAAYVLIRRDLMRFVRWRWDSDSGMSDDPCLHHDAKHIFGVDTYVRHDCVGRHFPETIGAIETRGHDMTVVRA